jgi:polar amino acid transport system substrate-binding protein
MYQSLGYVPSMLGIALFSATLAAQAVEPVHLATHNQPPYGTYKTDGSFDGIAVQVVTCALRAMGRTYKLEVFPWERAQMLAEKGRVDGFFPATIKPERLLWADASQVIAEQKWVWYMPAGSTLDPSSAQFKAEVRVGAHFGSNRLKMLEAGKYQVVFKPQTDAALLEGLMLGRAQAILGGDLAIAAAMQEQHVDPHAFKTVVAQDSPLHAYFGHKFLQTEPDFMVRFNAQIAACR